MRKFYTENGIQFLSTTDANFTYLYFRVIFKFKDIFCSLTLTKSAIRRFQWRNNYFILNFHIVVTSSKNNFATAKDLLQRPLSTCSSTICMDSYYYANKSAFRTIIRYSFYPPKLIY